jgi:hypothetical protein
LKGRHRALAWGPLCELVVDDDPEEAPGGVDDDVGHIADVEAEDFCLRFHLAALVLKCVGGGWTMIVSSLTMYWADGVHFMPPSRAKSLRVR